MNPEDMNSEMAGQVMLAQLISVTTKWVDLDSDRREGKITLDEQVDRFSQHVFPVVFNNYMLLSDNPQGFETFLTMGDHLISEDYKDLVDNGISLNK